MILTGKALIDFNKWFDPKHEKQTFKEFDSDLFELFCFSIIIEWFDSVKIYIIPQRSFAFEEWKFEIKGNFSSGFVYKSRKEAMNHGILVANNLYNA